MVSVERVDDSKRDDDSKGHVNNVVYVRYAESGRVAWAQKYAYKIDPEHKEVWRDIATPRGSVGMILRKITTEYKFVSLARGYRDQQVEY